MIKLCNTEIYKVYSYKQFEFLWGYRTQKCREKHISLNILNFLIPCKELFDKALYHLTLN